MYGIPVAFTFKGKEKFNTSIGGIATLAVVGIVLAYTITQVRDIIKKENTAINSNVISRSLLEEKTEFDIGKKGFIIGAGGINSQGDNYNILYDPSYLSVSYRQYSLKRNKIGADPTENKYTTLGTKA